MFEQNSFILEACPFTLTITDESPLLSFDPSDYGDEAGIITLFEGAEEAAEFVEKYHELLLSCMRYTDGVDADICLRLGIESYLKRKYEVEYEFDDSGFSEFREHVLVRLANLYKIQQKLCA